MTDFSARFGAARQELLDAYAPGRPFDWGAVERAQTKLRLLLAEKKEWDKNHAQIQVQVQTPVQVQVQTPIHAQVQAPRWRRKRPWHDMTGRRFFGVVVVGLALPQRGNRQYYWHIRCDCGTEKVVSAKSLRSGYVRSCGCLRQAQSRINAAYMDRLDDGRFAGVAT